MKLGRDGFAALGLMAEHGSAVTMQLGNVMHAENIVVMKSGRRERLMRNVRM